MFTYFTNSLSDINTHILSPIFTLLHPVSFADLMITITIIIIVIFIIIIIIPGHPSPPR